MAFAVACSAALPAIAQESDVAKLREELRQLREAYESRIQALEKKIRDVEAASEVGAKAAPPAPRVQQATESAFNPAISLILQGGWARSSQDPENYQISGFAPSGGEVAPPRRGFGLGGSELFVTGSIDPYFRGQLVASFSPENELEVAEAFFETLALGSGLTLKGGRFLSAIGYQNEIHEHAWDFADAPLAYKAFLGGAFNDDGVQLRWLAPTDVFLELGGEIGRGRGFPASDRPKNGAGAWALFGHVGGDIGQSMAWRAGLSHLRTSPAERAFNDVDSLGNPVTQAFSGTSRLWIADFVLKWSPLGNASRTNLKLQGEYFRRRESGTLNYDDSGQMAPQFGTPFTGAYASLQSGWYLQTVYQFMPRWRAGYRLDRLHRGDVSNGIVATGAGPSAADFALLMAEHQPSRQTLMVDFSPTEFSRFRVQFAADRSRLGVTDRQLILQYIHSLGAHGAHRF